MLSSRRRRRTIALPEITLTPLIDTTLCLLIIFMVTSPMLKDSLRLNLPEVKNSSDKVKPQNKLEIFVDKNDQIQIGQKSVKFEDLKKEVEKWLQESNDKIILINGDKEICYDSVMKILSEINSIEGEKYVALVCKKTVV